MLHDMVTPESLPRFDSSNPEARKVLQQTAVSIQSSLKSWLQSDDKHLASLSLRALALTNSAEMLEQSVKTAQSGSDLTIRIQAVKAVAQFDSPQSQKALRDLAKNDHYLIRATAVSHLDPNNPDDKAVLLNAQKDTYAIVAETANRRLNP